MSNIVVGANYAGEIVPCDDPVHPIHLENIVIRGMSKRELFAGMAMQALIHKYGKHIGEYSENVVTRGDHLSLPSWIAKSSLDYADRLIKALEP